MDSSLNTTQSSQEENPTTFNNPPLSYALKKKRGNKEKRQAATLWRRSVETVECRQRHFHSSPPSFHQFIYGLAWLCYFAGI